MLELLAQETARLDAGCEVISLQDPAEVEPVFGFAEGLRAERRLRGALDRVEASVVKLNPDAAVLISFSGLHLPLGRRLRRRGLPVLYLGPPQVWAWGGWRTRQLRQAADRVACLFRFEEELLRRAGVNAVYLGYPLLDGVVCRQSREQTLEKLGLSLGDHYVVFLPGSRPAEIAYHRPLFGEVLARLRRTANGMRGVMVTMEEESSQEPERGDREAEGEGREACCPTGAAEAKGGDSGIVTVSRDRYGVMRHADCACAVSGTVTAELAILGVPMVVSYHLPRASRVLARAFVRIPHFALPNILAGTRLVPEVLEPRPEDLARMLEPLTRDSDERRSQLAGLARVAVGLGPQGAMTRISSLVRDLAVAGRQRAAGDT